MARHTVPPCAAVKGKHRQLPCQGPWVLHPGPGRGPWMGEKGLQDCGGGEGEPPPEEQWPDAKSSLSTWVTLAPGRFQRPQLLRTKGHKR